MHKPLCFVLMPFGKKPDSTGLVVDFDTVYGDVIAKAVDAAGLECIRADEEQAGGIIHKPMFERLILCEYAVADLTTANANVFYELGVRHAVRPWSTTLLYGGSSRLPFDVAPLQSIRYRLTPAGLVDGPDAMRAELTARLRAIQDAHAGPGTTKDSPLFQLIDGFPRIDASRADAFRDRVHSSRQLREQIAVAGRQGAEALRQVEQGLSPIATQEAGLVLDLFLAYRDCKAFDDMIALVAKMGRHLAATPLVQEQLALALNRRERSEEAERVLTDLLEQRGPSSETCGHLGRIYKDRWEAAQDANQSILAQGFLDNAINAYLRGLDADPREVYCGINVLTLMEVRDDPDPRRLDLLPVVAYAVRRRIAAGKPDYWDHATLLELAVLGKDKAKAITALGAALALRPVDWMRETTARNLRLIAKGRARRGESVPWADELERALRPPQP
jgi:tetratricopeptide (TPR) repeat protein